MLVGGGWKKSWVHGHQMSKAGPGYNMYFSSLRMVVCRIQDLQYKWPLETVDLTLMDVKKIKLEQHDNKSYNVIVFIVLSF